MFATMRGTLTRAVASANAVAVRNPFATAVVVTAAKTTLADIMTQKIFEGSEELDQRRTLAFAVFGASYQGAGQFFLWNLLMPRIMPIARFGWVSRVAFVNVVADPLFFFPSFYSIKTFIHSPGMAPLDCVETGLREYSQNYWQDWKNSWMVWLPGHCVTARLPAHLKVPFVAAASFGYVCILSATRGESKASHAPAPRASDDLSPQRSVPLCTEPGELATGASPSVTPCHMDATE